MSDFVFGSGEYDLNYYPKNAINNDMVDWEKVKSIEIDWVSFVRERTCEDVSTKHGLFICSECGCRVDEEGVDNGGVNFCPDCGAVIEQ